TARRGPDRWRRGVAQAGGRAAPVWCERVPAERHGLLHDALHKRSDVAGIGRRQELPRHRRIRGRPREPAARRPTRGGRRVLPGGVALRAKGRHQQQFRSGGPTDAHREGEIGARCSLIIVFGVL
ncbi:unnamed protein product, partial [Prorocentrum cordatum]